MQRFSDISIGRKLSLGFGVALAAGLVVAVVGFRSIGTLSVEADNLANVALPRALILGEIGSDIRDTRNHAVRVAITEDPKKREGYVKMLQDDAAAVEDSIARYKSKIRSDEDRINYDKLDAAWQDQEAMITKLRDLATAGKLTEARDILDGESYKHFKDEIVAQLDTMTEWNTSRSATLAKQLDATSAQSKGTMAVVLGLSLFATLGIALAVTRGIKRPVQALSERMTSLNERCMTELQTGIRAMQDGDLTFTVTPVTRPVENPGKDELGRLSLVFNSMLEKAQATILAYEGTRTGLSSIARGIQESSLQVASTSQQLASAADETSMAAENIATTITQVSRASEESARASGEIAQGSEQLARSTTEAAQAMERLEKAIEQVQEGGERQRKATDQADQIAREGSKAVDQTVSSMQRIQHEVGQCSRVVADLGEKGQQIGEIVQTIDDIAEQTNLLALNAAIEAARAGEQGKGFAVVADEVRKLAERSSAATQEIATLITSVRDGVANAVKAMEQSNAEVRGGVENSSAAGESLRQILEAMKAVDEVAKATSTAVETMVQGSRSLAGAVSNAASISEEAAASAQEMSASAQEVSASAETVNAAVEEQTSQIEEVRSSTRQLSVLAEDLRALAARFTLDGSEPRVKLELQQAA